VYDRAYPYFDADGSLLRYVGATLDVTERKQAEDALRQSREDLDRAQAVGHIGWWRLDVLSNVLNWSDENYRIFGAPPGTPLTYETFLGMVHPDDRHYVGTRWKAALAGEPYDIEHRILADGRMKWVREKAFPEYDEEGTLKGGFGITQDITERKRTEDALIESEVRFRQVAESLPQLVWTCAADGPCDYLSPQWQRYTGKYGAEQLGYGWLEQLHPDDRERVIAQWRSTTARGENFECAFRIRRHDGTYRWFRTLAVPLRDEAGRIVKWFGSNTDIDDIKRTEEMLHQQTHELEQLSLTLEQRVQERTEELRILNRELLQSQNRLKQLSRDLLDAQEKERKKVAWELHDSIGSSLTAIKFRIENVLRESVSNGSQAMDHLQKLVPVVQTAVMEAKRIQMNLRPSILDDIGIVATTRWFCTQFRETYPEVQLARHVKIEEDDVPDSLKTVIFRIFQEGLNNAARHSKSPQVSFYMWKSNKTLRLLIRDRGEGFDLSEVQSRTGYVRGLGLESMRERAELSGGRFIIATRQGKGTTIRVSWPLTGNS
jgi:PAS domain S-box-containing protein